MLNNSRQLAQGIPNSTIYNSCESKTNPNGLISKMWRIHVMEYNIIQQ